MKKILLTGLFMFGLVFTFSTVGAIGNSVSEISYTKTSNIENMQVLRRGVKNQNVLELQKKLKDFGYYNKALDADYGSGTIAAVKKFQQKGGLKVDGIVGPKTYAMILSESNNQLNPQVLGVSTKQEEISRSFSPISIDGIQNQINRPPRVSTLSPTNLSSSGFKMSAGDVSLGSFRNVSGTFLYKEISSGNLEAQIDTLMFQLGTTRYKNTGNIGSGVTERVAMYNANGLSGFDSNLNGLEPNTNYVYVACIKYQDGFNTINMKAVCGDMRSVTTTDDNSSPEEIEVITKSPVNVGNTNATLRGEVNEGENVTVKFALSDSSNVNCSNSSEQVHITGLYDEGDNFQKTLNSLSSGISYYYRACAYKNGETTQGVIRSFTTGTIDIEPEASTSTAGNIDGDSARLFGRINMNDAPYPGIALFVWGQDEDLIEDVDEDFTSYSDINEEGEDLQKYIVANPFEGSGDIMLDITNLDEDTDYYYRACVSYMISDAQAVLTCGDVEDFETSEGIEELGINISTCNAKVMYPHPGQTFNIDDHATSSGSSIIEVPVFIKVNGTGCWDVAGSLIPTAETYSGTAGSVSVSGENSYRPLVILGNLAFANPTIGTRIYSQHLYFDEDDNDEPIILINDTNNTDSMSIGINLEF